MRHKRNWIKYQWTLGRTDGYSHPSLGGILWHGAGKRNCLKKWLFSQIQWGVREGNSISTLGPGLINTYSRISLGLVRLRWKKVRKGWSMMKKPMCVMGGMHGGGVCLHYTCNIHERSWLRHFYWNTLKTFEGLALTSMCFISPASAFLSVSMTQHSTGKKKRHLLFPFIYWDGMCNRASVFIKYMPAYAHVV